MGAGVETPAYLSGEDPVLIASHGGPTGRRGFAGDGVPGFCCAAPWAIFLFSLRETMFAHSNACTSGLSTQNAGPSAPLHPSDEDLSPGTPAVERRFAQDGRLNKNETGTSGLDAYQFALDFAGDPGFGFAR